MSPHLDGKGGTFLIDRVFPGVGRIKRASGTTKLTTFKAINQTLDALFEAGRLDLLRDVRDGVRRPIVLYRAAQEGTLDKLPRGPMAAALFPVLWAWRETSDVGDDQKNAYAVAIRRLERTGTVQTPVMDLPALVRTARAIMRAEGHARTFNVVRAAALAFARDTQGRHTALWTEIAAVPVLKVRPRPPRPFFSVVELDQILGRMPAPWQSVAWVMVLTGMGPREFYGTWAIQPDRIHIHGTKRAGRVRDVPAVDFPAPAVPSPRDRQTFKGFSEGLRRALFQASDDRMTPYDLRRTYSRWLEGAGIPRTRRMLYMGHGASDVTFRYERAEVTAFLRADAGTLTTYLAAERQTAALTLVRAPHER